MDKFAIPRRNIVYILAGLALIILGYILLSGGGAENQQVFNYDLFSFSRIKPLKKNK